ncbi:hypothetical protein AGABI2DRAFT_184378 [Agaricus bisporus var. bisporus H97]|uniref:hypothetical protein n=1 Tax=Agaricus bisporus var. bisporus (strain H97 / ATCC MYA-4626 / FGSC 10389) TaxID=936046 RepID=UPI00029F743D|nr:hypothetical protein AGABI2DRAFT_184378 [Agaricus bisporus var. bisporus H97]EKV48009.1 hypothetical protein AGABI2DRAFT_184378 [Agaricus bisporus var. bisporus H97]
MSAESDLERLVNQCRSNDVDVKVDALAKLQTQFESGVEIDSPDTFINVFKNCLRSSNQHMTTAAVSALLPFLPIIFQNGVADITTLRSVLVTLFPLVIDRLSDKDRVQIKAREFISRLGAYSFKSGSSGLAPTRSRDGKGPETPNMVFERLLKELGLASKVWKIREQSILVLVSIRKTQYQFPIRPYLSLLVDCLEDTDAHVRDCARSSVVELFTGPGVSDAARADLKKEMTKKGVRKTILDSVLSKVLAASSTDSAPPSREGSENGDAKKEYVPPSLMLQGKRPRTNSQSRTFTPMATLPRTTSYSGSIKDSSRPQSRAGATTPPTTVLSPLNDNAEVQIVFVASGRDLENEFVSMAKPFEGKETEHNWAAREQSILRVRGMLKGDVHQRFPDVFMASLKDGFFQWTLKTLASLRTTVATNTCQLYSELAVNLGSSLDPFCDFLLSHLLKMSSLTKKITAQQSQASVTTLLTYTSAQPRVVIPLLWATLQEKTVQSRAFVMGHIKTYLEVHGHRAKNAIEGSGNLEVLDKCMRKAISDVNPSVRETARKIFWTFDDFWPENGSAILESLDATARKQLEKACPNPGRQNTLPPTTPSVPKKGSIAAAIAASRAKAKAIATAPPTLRHQATSTSHGLPSQRRSGSPRSPSTSPRNSYARPSSPLSPPHSRGLPARTVPAPVPQLRARTPSFGSGQNSPPSVPETVRRGSSGSSPARGSTLRKTMRTVSSASLPASPPQVFSSSRTTSTLSRNTPVPLPPPRASTLLPQMGSGWDESLLLAQSVPIPLDDESEDDDNLMSFSAPFHTFTQNKKDPLTPPDSQSLKSADSKPTFSVSNALSSGSIANVNNQPVVEDALKARAEQAESAAERLLELVEPEAEGAPHPTLPPSLLVGKQSKPAPNHPPVTPENRASVILKQAAMFEDSPAYSGKASLMDVLQESKQEGWWAKRRSADNPVILSPPTSPGSDSVMSPSPFDSSRSMPSLHLDLWDKDKNFNKLYRAMMEQLTPEKDAETLEAGLVAVCAFIENQLPHLDGKEAELFATLLRVRYCNQVNVLEATNATRDMLTSKLEPVYGLTTMHASLKDFYESKVPSMADEETKAAAHAFGLIALGKFILRLPAEVAEEELPRLKGTLISSLNDKSSLIIRESAAASIIAAQLVLRDETHLFALLDGLADDKKNLLTYLFDKHGARGMTASNRKTGLHKLEKEIRRLDTRTSTPSRTPRT